MPMGEVVDRSGVELGGLRGVFGVGGMMVGWERCRRMCSVRRYVSTSRGPGWWDVLARKAIRAFRRRRVRRVRRLRREGVSVWALG